MIVNGADGIGHLSERIRTAILPVTGDIFIAADLNFIAMCIDMIAEDYDRAVDILLADRAEMKEIFLRSEPHLEGGLHDRVLESLKRKQESFRVHVLTEAADADMRLLIDLHAEVEKAGGGQEWRRETSNSIWLFIENYAERRIYQAKI